MKVSQCGSDMRSQGWKGVAAMKVSECAEVLPCDNTHKQG
jgi:hypothetical protein